MKRVQLLKKWILFLQQRGVDDPLHEYLQEKEQNLFLTREDFYWQKLQQLLKISAQNASDLNAFQLEQLSLYGEMRSFLIATGRNINHINRAMYSIELERSSSCGMKMKVEFLANPNCCRNCVEFHLHEIDNDGFPLKHCTRENGCLCGYCFRPIRNGNSNC